MIIATLLFRFWLQKKNVCQDLTRVEIKISASFFPICVKMEFYMYQKDTYYIKTFFIPLEIWVIMNHLGRLFFA
jgi:hypothetical protein